LALESAAQVRPRERSTPVDRQMSVIYFPPGAHLLQWTSASKRGSVRIVKQ
jgi:hypothetical protein